MLRILPGHIANLIAAGEVVHRPASVVKELMENAVDAGADNIRVIIKDSGKTLIQVIDNGCGMSPEDAKLAFLRHATSKISEIEDLSHISTFGFRGEALASIAAVAEVTLRTRTPEDQTGSEVRFAESKLISADIVSAPVGSNFSVRNIFYNVPARRKFLKSDATEYRQILSEFSRVVITRPDLSFSLTHNNTEIYNLQPSNLRKRILDVAGREMAKELVNIGLDSPLVKISGFTGRPDDARKSPGHQYFFANNRYFRSSYFHKAVLKAYQNLIPDSYLPSYFIFFEVDPHALDVNIHPAKTEVKFEEEQAIFDMLHAVVRESLGKNSFFPSIDFDREGAPEIPAANTKFYVPPPKIDYDPLFNPFDEELKSRRIPLTTEEIDRAFHSFPEDGFPGGDPALQNGGFKLLNGDPRLPGEDPGLQSRDFNLQSGNSALRDIERGFYGGAAGAGGVLSGAGTGEGQILIAGERFILTVVESGVMVVNISRALERIFYERYLSAAMDPKSAAENLQTATTNPRSSSPGLLFSKNISVQEHVYSILKERQGELGQLGFSFRSRDEQEEGQSEYNEQDRVQGERIIEITSLPEGLPESDSELYSLIDSLIFDITETGDNAIDLILERSAAAMARSAAYKRKELFNISRAQSLLESLFKCREPGYTPTGKICYSVISAGELNKKFM